MTEDKYGIINVAWEAIENAYNGYKEIYTTLIFHSDKFGEFEQTFNKRYEDIKTRFMKEQTNTLDSHKQAAILTISCLESKVIEHKVDNNKISIVPQMIAINIGLSYMKDCMNRTLKKKGWKVQIEKYYFPLAIACTTPYGEIMCRILYHEQREDDMNFNVLELADRYFLLEYITLLQLNVEPITLREKES